MYYKQSIEEHNISIFKLFIRRTLGGYEGYKSDISAIVSEAKSLLKGEKTIYDLDNENYSLVTFLRNNDTGLLNTIDPNNINELEYKSLLSIFESQNQHLSVACMHNC